MRRFLTTTLAALALLIGLGHAAWAADAAPAPDTATDTTMPTPMDEGATIENADAPAATADALVKQTDDGPELVTVLDLEFLVHNLWILIAAFLVFIMHLGFATLESGLCQSKNTVNILFKNTMVPTIGLALYCLWGFGVMYPGESNWMLGKWFGFAGFGVPGWEEGAAHMSREYYPSYPVYTDFLFQGMFAATAMTIVSGCVAERIKLSTFLIFTVFYVGIVYPIAGSWVWGAGVLGHAKDFAGSTLVHSVGGWGGLAGIIVLGARKGKYGPNGEVRAILPSNLPMAAVGVFILWFGWFGFNGGSVLSADPASIAYVCVTTSIAAALGGITAGLVSWFHGKKPDLSMALNGILAGLVGITANADIASLPGAFIIGIICGLAVYFAVLLFDALKLDDPVGALSVHLVCGILGTMFCAVPALMHDPQPFLPQLLTVLTYAAFCFPAALVFWLILKAAMGIRVSEDEEEEGLDLGEHGVTAYAIGGERH
ncbi:MAG: ammonium transporter [Planctomycetota bacterium]